MRVFVTGGTGLLGGNLVRTLAAAGHDVSALIRSRAKAIDLLAGCNVDLVEGDLRDVDAFTPLLRGCDAVCHTAAYHREFYTGAGSHSDELETINVDGTRCLLMAAAESDVGHFVHISSCGVIGRKANGDAGDEETPPLPVELANQYFASKLRTDAAVAEFIRAQAKPAVVTVIPAWMLGPGDAAPSPGGQMVLDFLARKLPGIADGGQCMVDARDVVQSIVAALERGATGRYIVAGEYRTVEEIFASLERVTGIRAPRLHLPHPVVMAYAYLSELFGLVTGRPVLVRPAGVRALHAKLSWSSDKAVRELGVSFRTLDETMRDTATWFREHGMVGA